MDIFKFGSGDYPLDLEQGEYVNGITSVVWTERYAEPGEFEIQSPLSSDIRSKLPIGSLISHTDTAEIMMVENHEIKEEDDDDETMVVITGRSLFAYLEQRIIGNQDARNYPYIEEYMITANNSIALQITLIINDNFHGWAETDDGVAGFRAVTEFTDIPTPNFRVIPKQDCLKTVMELLPIDDLGLKVLRVRYPNRGFSEFPNDNLLVVHGGEDKTASVIFSWKSGDLDAVNYLFSNKKTKNAAVVVGRYVWVVIDSGLWYETDFNRRQMLVDGSDIDEGFTEPPAGADYDAVLAKMIERGRIALRNRMNIVLGQTDVSDVTQYQFRRDYNIGDLVTLDANFGQIAVMRVVEYTEIEDENGESGHPTLSLPYSAYVVTTHPNRTLGGFVVQENPEQ